MMELHEIVLYSVTAVLTTASAWGLIELTKNKSYRWLLWPLVPIMIAAVWSLTWSSNALKGTPTSNLPREEWTLVSYINVKGQGTYLWVIEKGKRQPTSLFIPYRKPVADKIDSAADSARKSGRPLKGKFQRPDEDDGEFDDLTDPKGKMRLGKKGGKDGKRGKGNLFGSEDHELRLWEFDVESTLPPKN